MQNFGDFDPNCGESRIPGALELKRVKQMLLAGDRDEILQSVETIKAFACAEESLSEIIRSDIPEFLCDAVVPFDADLVRALCDCLELMSKHVEFYTHSHSSFAIQSLMRTLHFIMKDSGSLSGLNQCLNLLNLIVQGYNNHGVAPEKKTIENLLHLLPTIVKNMTPTVNSKYQAGSLILNLLELNMLKHSQEALDIIFGNFCSWFNLLNEVLESEHPMKERLILLCCMLSHFVLRYFISKEDQMEEHAFEVCHSLEKDIISNVTEFLVHAGAPFVDNIPQSCLKENTSCLENFYQAVLCCYSDEITPEKSRLTHGLSEMGFLQFTVRIICYADFSNGQRLRRLCLLTLFHVILCLSEDVLHFPQLWPRGGEHFRSEIQHGIAQLPFDPSQWLDVLIASETPSSSKLAVLLYLYFHTMTAKSQDKLREIYPPIVFYIRVTREIESSILLLKVVWFVFVMSQLSVAHSASPESGVDGTDDMVALLEAQEDLSLIYTHHPALLYWAFSSRVSARIQTQTVHLWLRNKMPGCKELEDLMAKSPDVRFAVLDVVQSGRGQELDAAFSCLKSLIRESDDDLAASIWFLLPQVLARFTADSTSAVNVDYLIELCSLRTPETLDMARATRIAALLPEVFLKSDLISTVPSLSLTLQLLKVATRMEDTRGGASGLTEESPNQLLPELMSQSSPEPLLLCRSVRNFSKAFLRLCCTRVLTLLGNRNVGQVFLRHEGFVEKILQGLHSSVSDVSLICLQICNILWSECREMRSAEVENKVEVSKDTILRVLETNCEEVLAESLNFLQQVLRSNFRTRVFESSGDVSDSCWRCLKLFLTASPLGDGTVLEELFTHPLLHELISANLPRSHQSRGFGDFLATWLELNALALDDPCFEGKLFGGFYAETVHSLSVARGEEAPD